MAASLVMNPAAWASNLSFLEDSPMTYFDKEDMRLQREAALKVLEDKSSRAQQTWKNPATGHSGKVHGLGAFTSQDGLACRRVRIFNRAEGVESQATYTVCKYAEQGWMFDPSAQPAG
jgi:surface antigen